MSQLDQIRGQPVPAPTYTNDGYMAVFNRFTLRERLGLRLVCRRWKNVIETDCGQMKTLRVFGSKKHIKPYTRRMMRQVKPPTAEDDLKWDPNPVNIIILKRPAYDRVDIDFLARLFPAVQNLALTWHFGEFVVASVKNVRPKKKKDKNKQKRIKRNAWHNAIVNLFDSILEPDILGLLRSWAPNLRQLYFDTRSYTFKSDTYWFRKNCLKDYRSTDFWSCLSLMAPTLENLTLSGIDMKTVPQSLVLPTLEQLAFYQVHKMNIFESALCGTFFTQFPARLHKLAPVLRILKMDDDTFCKTQLPSTVTHFALTADWKLEYGEEESVIVCPSVTHLQVQTETIIYRLSGTDQYINNLLLYLARKYPSVKSLKVFDDTELTRFLRKYGEVNEGYSLDDPRREPAPIYNIEELHLVPEGYLAFIDDCRFAAFYTEWNWDITDYKYCHVRVDYEYVFQAIAAVFRGLKRLIFSVAPGKEATHQFYHERFIDFQARYLPRVELVFEQNIPAFKRERAFSLGVDYAREPDLCYLSPGCVLLGQADAPEADNSDPKKTNQHL